MKNSIRSIETNLFVSLVELRIAEIIKTTLGEATGEEWAGWKLPTLDEWEKAWVILMLQELKKMEII